MINYYVRLFTFLINYMLTVNVFIDGKQQKHSLQSNYLKIKWYGDEHFWRL